MNTQTLQHNFGTGYFDTIQFEASGIIRIIGWSTEKIAQIERPELYINGQMIRCIEAFQTYRPEAAAHSNQTNLFCGIIYQYAMETPFSGIATVEVKYKSATFFYQKLSLTVEQADYHHLLESQKVWHREDMYQEGPPVGAVSEEVLSLIEHVSGPVLDFGCGIGNLVKILRDRGVEAYGIELDRPAIREALLPEVAEYITLFDGSTTLPYTTGQFTTTIAIEVIEHIPEYVSVLQEIARITKNQFILSVPDASAIPLLFQNHVVPWHMLESTHLNFFTHQSLEKILQEYYTRVEMLKIGAVVTNNTQWHVSLAAICQK